MSRSATGTVLILQPEGEAEQEDRQIIRDCLGRAGLCGIEGAAGSLPEAEFSALLIRGVIAIRGYLSRRSSAELLDPRVGDTIRDFFHAGKPIAAPCMGLAVVIEALSGLLPESLVLAPEPGRGTVAAVYPALRLVTTNRPLLGRSPAEVSAVLTQVMGELRRLVQSC